MKLKFFTLLLLSSIFFTSCRKSQNQIDIKQYDQQQMESYISANGLTGMQRDLTSGDTTGIYYKIISPGDATKPVDYPDTISYVYTIRSFDGKFSVTDTVLNHYDGFLGHVVPAGVRLAIHNLLRYKGAKMRVLIPSHLAYGRTGGRDPGSSTVGNTISGNEGLDYTISLISDQKAYDELVITNYMAANGLSGYTRTADGLYYKITTPGTGNSIDDNSSLTLNYSIYLMNNTHPDNNSNATTLFPVNDMVGSGNVSGFLEGLRLLGKGGGAISIIVPSALAYGPSGRSGVPADACLRWDISNVTVTNH